MFYRLLLITFVVATIIQVAYWLLVFSRLAYYRPISKNKTPHLPPNKELPPVSIIICAKNEAENLQQNLPRILNQTYRSFEVLVVNDNSNDKSLYVLESFQKNYPTFRIINNNNVSKKQLGKKSALALGIQSAAHNWLLLTDADCVPSSENWLAEMMIATQSKSAKIGLGYSPYFREKGLLNKVIRYETVWTAVQYLSFALWGQPYMGVGRNLMYRKELFFEAGGFDSHAHIASGDDDLFINLVASGSNTTVILHPDTFVYSEPKHTWQQWYRQKTRHLSTGTRYRIQHQLLLGILSATHILHYTSGIAIAFYNLPLFITLLAVRMGVMMVIMAFILRRLKERDLLFWLPFFDIGWLLFYLVFFPALMNTQRNTTWT